MKAENKFAFDGRAYDKFIKVWAAGRQGRPYRGMEKKIDYLVKGMRVLTDGRLIDDGSDNDD